MSAQVKRYDEIIPLLIEFMRLRIGDGLYGITDAHVDYISDPLAAMNIAQREQMLRETEQCGGKSHTN